ncbi:tetratricopeptide repeat protein [Candidatus Peregrinibacteria bacterium]|nr:tetratricopeptide repeat protein [Candidatus Peregrinibacteria bacterium]
MKKITSILIISSFLFAACGNSKWDKTDKDISPEQKTYEENIISEQMTILEKDSTDVKALFQVAFEYQFLGEYRKAVNYYEKVIKIDAGHIAALNNLADIYEQIGEYDTSAEYIKQLYPLMPDSAETIKDTVRILLLAGDDISAEQALENFAKLKREGGETSKETTKLISSLKQQIEDYQRSVGK